MDRALAEQAVLEWEPAPQCIYETESFSNARRGMTIDFEDQKKVGAKAVALLSKKSNIREMDDDGNYMEQVSRQGLPSDQLDHKRQETARKQLSKF